MSALSGPPSAGLSRWVSIELAYAGAQQRWRHTERSRSSAPERPLMPLRSSSWESGSDRALCIGVLMLMLVPVLGESAVSAPCGDGDDRECSWFNRERAGDDDQYDRREPPDAAADGDDRHGVLLLVLPPVRMMAEAVDIGAPNACCCHCTSRSCYETRYYWH